MTDIFGFFRKKRKSKKNKSTNAATPDADNTDGDIPTHHSTRPTAVEEHWKEIKDASHRYSIPQSPLERSQGEPMYAAEPHATIPSTRQQEGGEEISKALKETASAAVPSKQQQEGGEEISKALKETASAAIPSTHQEVDAEEYSKSLKANARIAIPSTQLEEEFRSAREIMDLEVVRMREDLSRAAFTNERREMEAARAQMEFRLCKEELARMSAIKTEMENENMKLQSEVALLQRELARSRSEVEHLKEDKDRVKSKLDDKKRLVANLKEDAKRCQAELDNMQQSIKDREQTWTTIRRDITTKRDDAIRETCKVRRHNERLKGRIFKLKKEKSNVLHSLWEKKQEDKQKSQEPSTQNGLKEKGVAETQPKRDESQQAKVLSLELQLYRQARLVELLLDLIQEQDPHFTSEQRLLLVSAFTDSQSEPEMLATRLSFNKLH